jgi:uncharacterized protein YbaP (TraB family)
MFRSFFTCLLLLAAGICSAQQTSENSLLWQISGKGLSKPSYVFGTIHLICTDDFVWSNKISNGIKASDKVCFELDLDDENLYKDMASGMKDTSESSLREILTASQYQRLERFMKDSLHMNLSSFEQLNPTMLSSLLLVKVLSCGIPVSYEMRIQDEAEKSKKEIVGLEQVSEQLAVLNSVADSNQASDLMSLVDSLSSFREEYRKMVSIYKSQNLDELCKFIQSSDQLWEPLDALLDDRNKKWIPRMQSLMKNGSVFFAVGAAHLCGPNGVIALLRNAGYTMTPVY